MIAIKTPGAISWSELYTTDLQGAITFYKTVFGWEIQTVEMGDGLYALGNLGKFPVAGMMNRPSPDIPVSWGFYTTVTDVDALLTKAKGLGANILMDAMDVEGVGRMGTFMDTQGAVMSIMKYTDPDHEAHQAVFEHSFGTHGAFSWFELRVPDAEKAKSFYGELFGWKFTTETMERGPYHMINIGDQGIGGIFSVSPDEMPPHWGTYVTVSDVDDFAKSVTKHGGMVHFGPHDIPKIGRFVMFADPQGGHLAAITYKMPES